MNDPAHLLVNLDAVDHNLSVVHDAVTPASGAGEGPRVDVCAVLKADGYGLGAARLARRVVCPAEGTVGASSDGPGGGGGVSLVAVYHPHEARELLRANATNARVPILILAPTPQVRRDDPLFIALSRGFVHLTVHDRYSLDAAIATAESLGIAVPVHVEIDTGMARAGVPVGEAGGLIRTILGHRRLRLAGVATHFSTADASDEITREQAEAFRRVLGLGADASGVEVGGLPPTCRVHAANSFGVFRDPALHFTTVRVGLALLGYAVDDFADARNVRLREHAGRLRPALTWRSRIVQTKELAAGDTVGYGATWSAPVGGARIATVPIGYADGYPAALSSNAATEEARAWVLVHPSNAKGDAEPIACPVVGRVSMDQVTVDVSGMPEAAAGPGSVVDLVSADPSARNHLPRLAAAANTITHELLCRLSPKLPRVYTSDATAARGFAGGVTRPVVESAR